MRLIEKETSTSDVILTQEKFEDALEHFLVDQDHPCVMAKSLFKMDRMTYHVYGYMERNDTAAKLLQHIESYLDDYDFTNDRYETYLAAFPADDFPTEEAFENALWTLLQNMHLQDDKQWDPTVSSNPESPDFSFSIKGKAFYIVGMHPNSSRQARKSPYPMIAFNLHWQFERLREEGLFENVRDHIRQRDLEQNGSINPVLQDYGTASEALQYSGKKNDLNWKCPFQKI